MKRRPQAPVRSHQAPAAPHSPSHPAWLPPRQGSKIKAEERGNVRWRTIPGDTRELCVTQPELGPVPTQPGEPRRERKAGSAGLLPPVLQKEQKLKSILQFLNFLPCPLPFRKVHTYVFANRNIYIYILLSRLLISKPRMDHKIRYKNHFVVHMCWHQVRQFQLS